MPGSEEGAEWRALPALRHSNMRTCACLAGSFHRNPVSLLCHFKPMLSGACRCHVLSTRFRSAHSLASWRRRVLGWVMQKGVLLMAFVAVVRGFGPGPTWALNIPFVRWTITSSLTKGRKQNFECWDFLARKFACSSEFQTPYSLER